MVLFAPRRRIPGVLAGAAEWWFQPRPAPNVCRELRANGTGSEQQRWFRCRRRAQRWEAWRAGSRGGWHLRRSRERWSRGPL